MSGDAFTIWIVRAATILYAIAVALWRSNTCARGHKQARMAWTLACLCFLAHVYGAFEYFHHWSHTAAYIETARQTRDLMGVESGSGLYFNYVFLIVWTADIFWWWIDFDGYERRARWITVGIHGFLAFMFFNATVVFANGLSRWFGIAATAALSILWWISSRHAQSGAVNREPGRRPQLTPRN